MISANEIVEKALAVFLAVMSTMGMFMTGCLIGNVLFGHLSYDEMWIIFLGSLGLTAVLFPIMINARIERMLDEALEASISEDEEARNLYDHLKV